MFFCTQKLSQDKHPLCTSVCFETITEVASQCVGFCLLAALVPTYFLRWMNPLVFRTVKAVRATSRVAYVHEKTIPENCVEVAQGASEKGRPK